MQNKTLIGRRLRARSLPTQKVEARMGCAVIHRMTRLGIPSASPQTKEDHGVSRQHAAIYYFCTNVIETRLALSTLAVVHPQDGGR